MEPIFLMSCIACGKIVDQWTMIPNCDRCGTNRFKQVQPTAFIKLCWFVNYPRHVAKLLLQDLREKRHEKRS